MFIAAPAKLRASPSGARHYGCSAQLGRLTRLFRPAGAWRFLHRKAINIALLRSWGRTRLQSWGRTRLGLTKRQWAVTLSRDYSVGVTLLTQRRKDAKTQGELRVRVKLELRN